MVEEDGKVSPGILFIEDEKESYIYYCDSWGQYWDEIPNKKLDNKSVEAAK